MKKIKLKDYMAIPEAYRGVWTVERWDLPNWEEDRKRHMGKRIMLSNEDGATVLLVEGLSFEIIDEPEENPQFIEN